MQISMNIMTSILVKKYITKAVTIQDPAGGPRTQDTRILYSMHTIVSTFI
jgi:hypothetical protein